MSPGIRSKLTSVRALTPPKVLFTSRTLRMGSPAMLYLHPVLELVVFAGSVAHEPLALEHDEAHEDQGVDRDPEGAEVPSSSEMGTRIRQPITGPARVPPPPTTVAAMGMMEKSRANWLMPAHM